MQKRSRTFKKRGLALAVATASLAASVNTLALEFEFGESGQRVDWDTNVTYGVMWRVQSPDDDAEANVNDGTNNFKTGVVSNKVSVVSEADFQWGDYGFFVRGKAFYDYRYEDQDTDMSRSDYFTDNSGDGGGNWTTDIFGIPVGGSVGDVAREDFHPDTLDTHGKDAFSWTHFSTATSLLVRGSCRPVWAGSQTSPLLVVLRSECPMKCRLQKTV